MAVKLSICLMEYNRGDIIYKSVKSLLKCESQEFQIVVRDDASTDNTIKLLSSINDTRLKVNINDENVGAPLNWLYSLQDGDGDWLYLSMGRDVLEYDRIPILIQELDKLENQSVGIVRDSHGEQTRVFSYLDGINYFLSFGNHPTGLIYKREDFLSVNDPESFFRIPGFIYPEICMIRDILYKKRGAIIGIGLYQGYHYIDLRTVKSGIKFEADMFYFAPKARYLEFRTILRLTEKADGRQLFELNNKDADDRFIYLYNQLLTHVSVAWADFLCNEELTAHYNIPMRAVSKKELINNLFIAYITIKKDNIYINLTRNLKMIYWLTRHMIRIIACYKII